MPHLIGRDRELADLLAALDGVQSGSRAVVLEGEAGVGKTALWRLALDHAREEGWKILEAAPTRSEARLGFGALTDLLDPKVDAVMSRLPGPQRVALEIALLRRPREGADDAVDERLIAAATLSALRALAGGSRLLVAIDDLQWVDPASIAALLFALRRLRDEPILVIATRRLDPSATLDPELARLLADDSVRRVRVKPLSLGALHELLLTRLGLDASRPTLVRLRELTGGNPLFALEIGRELVAHGREPRPDEALPVPSTLRDIVQARYARLSGRTRAVLLAAAVLARPTRSLLARLDVEADAALDEATAEGMIAVASDGRVRFAHPLLASIHYEQTPLEARRRIHACLSALVDDPEESARHLALGTAGTDEGVAARLDVAGRAAALRGAPHAAAELCDLAARLTPAPPGRARRVLASAEYLRQVGNLALARDRSREVLQLEADSETRARALSVLGTVAGDSEGIDASVGFYRQALREPGAPRALRADVHHKLAWWHLVAGDARTAHRHAHAMFRLAGGSDQAAEAAAAATLSHVLVVRGHPVPQDLLSRAMTLEAAAREHRPWTWFETSPAALEGVVLLWAGELERARGPLERMLSAAVERSDLAGEMHALAYLSSLETSLGRPRLGLELARRYLTLATSMGHEANRSGALWPTAVAAAWLGRSEEAREAAREGLELAERMGQCLYVIGSLTALGAVELSLDDAAAAAEPLLRAWSLAERGGIFSIARFPALPDAIEALAASGEVKRAADLASHHERIARTLGRPWALALSARSAALIAEARGEHARACAAFDRALREHERQSRPLDHARTLLSYGRCERRRRQKSKARALLERSAEIFDAVEARGWAELTRTELARIGGRRPAANGKLSASESAIARLAAAGKTNREVAALLHLSDRTVEWNLSKVYRKLGVRSRTELVRALTAGENPA